MTRKRVRNSIVHALTEPCFYCEGKGYLRSIGVVCDSILFALHQQMRSARGQAVEVRAHPKVTEALVHDWEQELELVESLYDAQLELSVAPEMHVEWFEVRVGARGSPSDSRRAVDLPPDARGGDQD
jgi:ribonuclease G